MATVKQFDQPYQVTDWSEELNAVTNQFAETVKRNLCRFDIKFTNDPTKTNHYPVSYFCNGSPEEIATALELISEKIWATVQQVVLMDTHQARMNSNSVKVGKVYVSVPNKFNYVNTELSELKAFAFGYPSIEGSAYEMQGEINFSVELY